MDDRHTPYLAEVVPEPGGHEHIRALLRQRYGWRDLWIAMLQDTSGSREVRLVAAQARVSGKAGDAHASAATTTSPATAKP